MVTAERANEYAMSCFDGVETDKPLIASYGMGKP
jgi:hypothetical protein